MVSMAVHFNLILTLQIILREENEVKRTKEQTPNLSDVCLINLILIKNNFLAEQVGDWFYIWNILNNISN